jgi:kynurenine formamidase
MTSHIVDLTHIVDETIPAYPGDSPYGVHVSMRATGAGVDQVFPNLSQVKIGLHVGTHGDAPYHFVPNGDTIDQVNLTRCLGPACLISLDDFPAGEPIVVDHFKPMEAVIRKAPRVLIRTGWDKRIRESDYFERHPWISPEAAKYLVDLGLLTIGLDFPSVDYHPYSTHFALLGAKVFIVENLKGLDRLPLQDFQFSALPLNLRGRDGSPVRAVAFW